MKVTQSLQTGVGGTVPSMRPCDQDALIARMEALMSKLEAWLDAQPLPADMPDVPRFEDSRFARRFGIEQPEPPVTV